MPVESVNACKRQAHFLQQLSNYTTTNKNHTKVRAVKLVQTGQTENCDHSSTRNENGPHPH